MTEKDFNKHYKQHFPVVFRTALKVVKDEELAQDITSEVFISLFKKTSHEDNVRAFLIISALNLSRNEIKRIERFQRLKNKYTFHIKGDETEEINETRIGLMTLLMEKINQLPSKRREIFLLHANDDFSYEEISDKLKININTCRVQIFRSVSFLKESLSGIVDINPEFRKKFCSAGHLKSKWWGTASSPTHCSQCQKKLMLKYRFNTNHY